MSAFFRPNPNVLGVFCLVGALVFLTISDSIIKWLSPYYALHEITLFRSVVALVVLLIFVQCFGKWPTLRTRRPGLHLCRGLLLVLANMFFFLGLSVMPLAEVMTLFFTGPLFICLLAKTLLGEVVGLLRWLAILVSMVGVVVLVEPGSNEFTWASVLPVLAALTYSLMVITTRKLGMSDSAEALTLYIQLAFILVSTLSGLLLGQGQFNVFGQPAADFLLRAWQWPTFADFQLLLVCGVVTTAGAYLLSQSYRIAQASVVAPFEYTSLPFAVLVGYLVWGDLPGIRDGIGSTLIIGSGLLMVYYEFHIQPNASPTPETQP